MGKSGNKSLKAALFSHQSRIDKKQKAVKAAENKTRRSGPQKLKRKGKEPAPRATIPFTSTDKILLIGEGNFSFAWSLAVSPPSALEFLPAENITATSYDSQEQCYQKYPDCQGNVTQLREKGVEVLFNVDATRLEKHSTLKGRKWDRIVWNFPHAGKGITDQDRNILANQMLVLGFLRSAANFLTGGPVPSYQQPRKGKKKLEDDEDDEMADDDENGSSDGRENLSNSSTRGTVLITLRNVPPYTLWDVPKLAKKPPPPKSSSAKSNPIYTLLRSFQFHRSAWKGYEHRMTKGERAHGLGTTGEGGEDRTWEFCLKD